MTLLPMEMQAITSGQALTKLLALDYTVCPLFIADIALEAMLWMHERRDCRIPGDIKACSDLCPLSRRCAIFDTSIHTYEILKRALQEVCNTYGGVPLRESMERTLARIGLRIASENACPDLTKLCYIVITLHLDQVDMPRIPYVFPERGESAVADSIRHRRDGKELTELDGILLNAPKIAEGYNALLKAVRSSNSLSADVRELIILRVAVLNSAAYEWIQHEPIARAAGLEASQLALIRDVSAVPASLENLRYDASKGLSPLQAAALVYTDYVTRCIAVPQAVFDALRSELKSEQQLFEVTATAAAYNMVSRILVAMDVGDKAEVDVPLSPNE